MSRCLFIEPREATEKELLMKHTLEQIEILKATDQCNDEEFLEELSSRFDAIYIHPVSVAQNCFLYNKTLIFLKLHSNF